MAPSALDEKRVEQPLQSPTEGALRVEENAFSSDERLVQRGGSFKGLAGSAGPQRIDHNGGDPRDPLNWKQWKKNSFLLIISAISFLADFGSSTGSITLLPQSAQWKLPLSHINHALVGSQFMIGAGGLVVVILSAIFGRLPVLFYFLTVAVGTAAWCGAATNFDSFMTARILNGFFSTVAQAGGLMWIRDMYFPHEHARKINIWSSFIIIAPFVGPLVSAFIVNQTTWRWVFWLLTMLSAICWVLCVLFLDETFVNRKAIGDPLAGRKSRVLRLLGVEQHQRNLIGSSFPQALKQTALAITKLPVFLSSLYYMFVFAWVIGLNAAINVFIREIYGFRYDQIGYFCFAPIVGVLLGALASHVLQIFAARIYAKRHHDRIDAEAYLLPAWVATPMMVLGIAMVGVCLQHEYHYMALAVVWALYVSGIIIVTTAVNAYCLASYPELSGEVAAWINEGRILGGFLVNYFELKWVKAMGAEKALGIQAAIVMAAVVILVVLQFLGKRLRLGKDRAG